MRNTWFKEHKFDEMHIITRAIIEDNEAAVKAAYLQGDYVICFLLIHALIEAILRALLKKTKRERFTDLIKEYERFMRKQGQKKFTFVDELTKFNKRRNDVIHELWERGYTATNRKLESVCRKAFLMYGLFIEWLETFEPEIKIYGFEYE